MRNIILCLVVVIALVGGTLAGTFAGYVDTEESQGNFVQAGISDLLINGMNDPAVPAKIQMDHLIPGKSNDFWADAYNWGKCQGGDLYLHFKDVTSVEAGTKTHNGVNYVYDGVTILGGDIPDGYRVATGNDPQGAGVWSSEPEKIAEVGGGYIANTLIATNDPNLKGEDYATGVAQNLDITVEVFYKGLTGNELGNPDDPSQNPGATQNNVVSSLEQSLWVTNSNRIVVISGLAGKLWDIKSRNVMLGFLRTQEKTYIHFDAVIDQIPAVYATPVDYDKDGDIDGDDTILNWWPTNALQGDKATWTMLFSLVTDDPPVIP
jgi:hypothetical protein